MRSARYRILRSYKDTPHGPSDRIRTCGILLPKQARYQLRYTRLLSCFIRLGVFSQMWRPTDWATPGYLLVMIIARNSCDSKYFPVCGHLCGQSGFSARVANVVKPRKCPCFKGLCDLSGTVTDEVRTAPKPSALSTALVPDRVTQILSQFFKNCNAFFPIDVWRALWYYFYLVK